MADRRYLRWVEILRNSRSLILKASMAVTLGADGAPLGDLGTLWGHFGITLGRFGLRFSDLGTLQGHFGDHIVLEYRFSS